jgi:hypothetical protein
MALTINGSGATAVASGTTSVAATITTPATNNIILAYTHCENPAAQRTVSGVSGGGLTWARRAQFLNSSAPWSTNEVWWAAAPAALTSQTITVTFSAAIDDCSLQLIAVNGVLNLVSPWDTNGSLPATGVGPGTPVSRNISTTAANTMLLGFTGDATSNVPATGTGFTLLYTTANSGGANFSFTKSQYQVFTSAQTNYAATFGGVVQGSAGYIFDALAAVAAASAAQARAIVLA